MYVVALDPLVHIHICKNLYEYIFVLVLHSAHVCQGSPLYVLVHRLYTLLQKKLAKYIENCFVVCVSH